MLLANKRCPTPAVKFSTREFELAHGHKPRGFGSWAFNLDLRDEPLFWVHQSTYANAKKLATAHTKEVLFARGHRDGVWFVEVCS